MGHYSVERCVCRSVTFKTLQEIAKKNEYKSVKEIQVHGLAADGCGLCVPYIREMLKTGKTSFEPGSVFKNKSA